MHAVYHGKAIWRTIVVGGWLVRFGGLSNRRTQARCGCEKRVALCISDLPRGAFHFRLYRSTTTDTGVESGRLSSETLKSYISNVFTSRQALITYITPIISKILQQECGSTVALQIYMAPDLNSRPICFSFQPSLDKPGCTGPSSFDVVNESIPSSA